MIQQNNGMANVSEPGLTCYAMHRFAPKIVAARHDRQWMDDFHDRHPYRCLPLSIANSFGWHVLCPVPIEIDWNGGPALADIRIRGLKPLPGGRPMEDFCRSNFSRGIVTFHLDYIFRTPPGQQLLATGPSNLPKDNASPLTGIIETDWLPYPFTMNWKILRPGRVRFEEDEPFCLIYPVRTDALLAIEPVIRYLAEEPEIERQHDSFRRERDAFMKKFHAGDAATLKQAWQKHYFVGRYPNGTPAGDHLNKLRLKDPVDRRNGPAPTIQLQRPYQVTITPTSKIEKPWDPRWHRKSILNRIETRQTRSNVVGRSRIDGQGLLRDWSTTKLIRSAAEATGHDFVVAQLLDPEQCNVLSKAFWELESKIFQSDSIDPYWNNRLLWYADIVKAKPEVGDCMLQTQHRAIELVSNFYRLKVPLYADLLQIVRWNAGMFMKAHADNAHPDGHEHDMAHRDLSGILYLNDDYEGGELYFTAQNIAIKPRAGMFVAMTAGFHHEHAVLRVQNGARLTMPSFFTFEKARADSALRT